MARTEELLWKGDGFSQAEDQVGRRVHIGCRRGTVVKGEGLTIVVRWDPWWERLWKWITGQRDECICHETVVGKDICPIHGKHWTNSRKHGNQ